MNTIYAVKDEQGNLIGARSSQRVYTHALVVPVIVDRCVPPPPGSKFDHAYEPVVVPGVYEVASYFGSPSLAARGMNHRDAKRALAAGGEPKIVPVEIGTPADRRKATALNNEVVKARRETYLALKHYTPPGWTPQQS